MAEVRRHITNGKHTAFQAKLWDRFARRRQVDKISSILVRVDVSSKCFVRLVVLCLIIELLLQLFQLPSQPLPLPGLQMSSSISRDRASAACSLSLVVSISACTSSVVMAAVAQNGEPTRQHGEALYLLTHFALHLKLKLKCDTSSSYNLDPKSM